MSDFVKLVMENVIFVVQFIHRICYFFTGLYSRKKSLAFVRRQRKNIKYQVYSIHRSFLGIKYGTYAF